MVDAFHRNLDLEDAILTLDDLLFRDMCKWAASYGCLSHTLVASVLQ